MSLAPNRTTRILTALSNVVASGYWIYRLIVSLRSPLDFDDAYMFYRYALHIREGLGISWNLDGIHTYGETSPLWGVVVLLLSYLPVSMSQALVLGSWLCSTGAIVAIAWAVAKNAQGPYLNSTWRVLPFVAIPLMHSYLFVANAVTGMETMLAVLLSGLFIGMVLAWARGAARPEVAGLVGALLFMDRPEAAAAVMAMPALAFLLLRKRAGNGPAGNAPTRNGTMANGPTAKGLAILWSVFLTGFALDFIWSRLYFGTALPLSFYMKSRHAYEGYHASWSPASSIFWLLVSLWPYLALQALARKVDWRRSVICLLPLLLVCGYLITVTQIMGMNSRYYIPYIAFLVVPSLLVLDRRSSESPSWSRAYWPTRRTIAIGTCGVLCLAALHYVNRHVVKLPVLLSKVDHRIEHRNYAYDPVHFQVSATTRLPAASQFQEMQDISKTVLKGLPKGSSMAATEVGYPGGQAPQVNIIDLAGLNDPEIALHGFDVDALLARKPDIIWMPHTDYTYQRGLMLSNPHLLEQYDVLVGAADYGIALRKDSPIRPLLDIRMGVLWHDLYPGYKMSDYLVQSTSWSGLKHRISTDEAVNTENEKDQIDTVAQR